MNKQLIKEVEEKLINEIFKKCYFISTNSECDVFFRYSPHVDCYDVDYHISGWKPLEDAIHINNSTEINYSNLKCTLKKLDKLWEELNKRMEENNNE